ncbi:MAG: hypothetical protein DMG12_10475 [Acidobacteria bacterium]|nr:MAG: hypothetical protein DMG12_10475 [Acidobacteriota bacterium]
MRKRIRDVYKTNLCRNLQRLAVSHRRNRITVFDTPKRHFLPPIKGSSFPADTWMSPNILVRVRNPENRTGASLRPPTQDLENENDFHLHLDSPEGAVLPFVLRSEGKEEEGALLVTTRLQSCAVRVKANNAWPF